jgi:predicted secreted protein
MASKIWAIAIVALWSMSLLGCGPAGQEMELDGDKADQQGLSTIEVDQSMNGQVVQAAPGDMLIVRLEGNPSAGKKWTYLSSDSRLPKTVERFSANVKLGGGGVYVFIFKMGIFAPGESMKANFVALDFSGATIDTFSISISALDESSFKAILVDRSMNGQTIQASVGDFIEVRLVDAGTPAYEWYCSSYDKSLSLREEVYHEDGNFYSFIFEVSELSRGQTSKMNFIYVYDRRMENYAAKDNKMEITVQVAP